MKPGNSTLSLKPVHVALGLIGIGAGLIACYGNVMAARSALFSTARPAAQQFALPAPEIASTLEKSDRLVLAIHGPYRTSGEGAFRVASAPAIKFYCRYIGFDGANQKHYVTGPLLASWFEACPAAQRLCKSAHLKSCRKYGLFRTN